MASVFSFLAWSFPFWLSSLRILQPPNPLVFLVFLVLATNAKFVKRDRHSSSQKEQPVEMLKKPCVRTPHVPDHHPMYDFILGMIR